MEDGRGGDGGWARKGKEKGKKHTIRIETLACHRPRTDIVRTGRIDPRHADGDVVVERRRGAREGGCDVVWGERAVRGEG